MLDQNDSADLDLVKSVLYLQEKCHRLVELVSEIQARSQGVELIMALLLGKILSDGSETPIVKDCLSELKHMRRPELDNDPSAFPDPKLLDDVVAILSGKIRQPWHPQVFEGGKRDEKDRA